MEVHGGKTPRCTTWAPPRLCLPLTLFEDISSLFVRQKEGAHGTNGEGGRLWVWEYLDSSWRRAPTPARLDNVRVPQRTPEPARLILLLPLHALLRLLPPSLSIPYITHLLVSNSKYVQVLYIGHCTNALTEPHFEL